MQPCRPCGKRDEPKPKYHFVDVKFMTAKDKELVLKAWEKFLKNGCRREDFTDRLYHHLTLHCEFVSHYDASGFYGVYFGENALATAQFFGMFNPDGEGHSVEYGYTHWLEGDYEDINQAMRQVSKPYITDLIAKARKQGRERDLLEAKRLLEKHNITTTGLIPEWK